MIRLSKLTDYGFVLLTQFAASDNENWLTARDLSDATGLPLPTVSKLLKLFSKHGILAAQRGIYGGYRLADEPQNIHVLNVIELVDGPIAITECACGESPGCIIEHSCTTRLHWARITERIRTALSDLTLREMSGPAHNLPAVAITPVCNDCSGLQGHQCGCDEEQSLEFSGDKP